MGCGVARFIEQRLVGLCGLLIYGHPVGEAKDHSLMGVTYIHKYIHTYIHKRVQMIQNSSKIIYNDMNYGKTQKHSLQMHKETNNWT